MSHASALRAPRRSLDGRIRLRLAAFACAAFFAAGAVYAGTPSISISQTPLTVTIPAHPQVVIAIGNSQSMDGTLAGAIMTGAGALGSSQSLLQSSSSPVDYTIPTGFVPPLNAGSNGVAPNTVTCSSGSYLCDNSASRLNIAKAAITSVVSSFIADTDFALMDYQTSNLGEYETWLYAMSPTSGPFVFTNTQVQGNAYAANPCYNYTSLSSGNVVYQDCANIASSGTVTIDSGVTLATAPYMQVSDTSDDPLINDVLYAPPGYVAPVCLVYGGPSPANPWPPNYSLSQYNQSPGNITESYSSEVNGCATITAPTNAGYVPYTPETMYMARGFGYDATQESAAPPDSPGYWAPLVSISQGTAGQNPTTASVSAALAYFTPFLAPETSSTGTTEIKASAEQSPLAGLLANALGYFKNVNPPSTNGCATQRYVILLTDGLPTKDLDGHSWPPPGSTAAVNYGESVSFNGDGSLNTSGTNDQAVLDTITTLTELTNAGIKTYVVGLGAGVSGSAASSVLTAMAIAGGTGNFFAASNPTALTQDLDTILAQVQQATQSVSSSAVNSTGIHVGSVAYQAQFTTSDVNQDWTGNLYAFPISATTGYVNTSPASAKWSAQTQLDGQSWTSRLIATWDPVAVAGTPFEWTTGTPTSGIASSTTLGQELSTNPSDANGQDALDYLRGNRSLEQSKGGPYRTRTHVLADIVDSAPLYVGPPSGPYQGTAYSTFQTQYANRPPVIYIGADDGMLHAIDAASGDERFAFIPNAVFQNLIHLTYPLYNQTHLFFVDGSPQAWDVQFSNGSWHTVLASGENAGGNSIFALDITNPAGITSESSLASNALWEFTDGNMGLTFGTPALATTNAGTLIFFGNGYDSPTEQPYVYALNPQTGAVAAKINLCSFVPTACNANAPNGLSGVTLVNSTGSLSGPANVLYAGDLQGNVWRVDVSSSNPANWTASVLFRAVDPSGNPQPITTQPVVSLNPDFPRLQGLMVYVGTGQLLATADLTTTQVESIYGLYDAMPNSSVITRSNLVQQTLSATTVTTVNGSTVNARTISSNTVSLPTQMGWYVDLTLDPGERVVSNPALVVGALTVTTTQPAGNSCAGGFNSWYYELNYLNGGTFPQPMFDVTESGQISTSGPNVAGVFLGNVYASAARVTSGSLGNGTASLDILINESGTSTAAGSYASFGQNQQAACTGGAAVCGDPILNILGKGGGQSRTAWWEIR